MVLAVVLIVLEGIGLKLAGQDLTSWTIAALGLGLYALDIFAANYTLRRMGIKPPVATNKAQ